MQQNETAFLVKLILAAEYLRLDSVSSLLGSISALARLELELGPLALATDCELGLSHLLKKCYFQQAIRLSLHTKICAVETLTFFS